MDPKDYKDANGGSSLSAAGQMTTSGIKRSSGSTSQQPDTNGNLISSTIATTTSIINNKSLHLNEKSSATKKPPSLKDCQQGKENQAEIFHNQENHEAAARSETFCCFECNRSLAKSRHLINLAGQMHKWHPECFKCTVCNHPLDREASCHVYKNKIVCREDYAKLRSDNSIKCSRCHWPIGASDWVRKAGQYVYHLACFSCDICLRQLSTGEQFTISIQGEKSIVRLLCRLHFAIKGSAGGTSQHQQQQTSLHTDGAPSPVISGGSSHNNHHHHHHRSHRHHLQSPPLDGRAASNSPTKKIHQQQFDFAQYNQSSQTQQQHRAQSYAHQRAPPVEKFQQEHHHQYLHPLASSSTSGIAAINSGQTLLLDSGAGCIGGARKCPSQEFDAETLGLQLSDEAQHATIAAAQRASATSTGSSSNASTSGGGGGGGSSLMGIPSKSKRVRTTFTEDQLSILQTHFQIDSNPDGQDLERIATITGLSKRVTQVWFQNSRARQKKYMIKRKPSSSAAAAAAAAVVAAASSIGLGGSSSSGLAANNAGGTSSGQLSSFGGHHQQHQIQRSLGAESGANVNGANRHQGVSAASGSAPVCFPQQKWSDERMSDRSELSLDGCATNVEDGDDLVDDMEDTRSSSSPSSSTSSSSSSLAMAVASGNQLMRRGSSGEINSKGEQ